MRRLVTAFGVNKLEQRGDKEMTAGGGTRPLAGFPRDALSGETISYQYDALRRLVTASATLNATGNPQSWRQDYEFDGFGNLTGRLQNQVTTLIPANAATNRLSNALYDANGNMTSGAGATYTFDVANRMKSAQLVSGGTEYYSYGADNKRVYKRTTSGAEEWTMYGMRGEKLGAVSLGGCQFAYGCVYMTVVAPTISFAGMTIWDRNAEVKADRLGTNRVQGAKFYPFGEEITSTTNDRVKFGTYTRDSFTGLDYADQRFYASSYGRFNTADPYQASGGPAEPGSWNRYSYVEGDPVNWLDSTGNVKQAPPNLDGLAYYWWLMGGYGSGGAGEGGAPLYPPKSKAEEFDERYKTNGFVAAASLGVQCQTAIAEKGISVKGLEALAVQVNYYNSTDSEIGGRSFHSYWGNGDFTNLNAVGGNATVPRLRDGNNAPSIVIHASFFLKPAEERLSILVHELLHIYTNKNDDDLRKMLGLDQSDSRPSPQITEWLNGQCRRN